MVDGPPPSSTPSYLLHRPDTGGSSLFPLVRKFCLTGSRRRSQSLPLSRPSCSPSPAHLTLLTPPSSRLGRPDACLTVINATAWIRNVTSQAFVTMPGAVIKGIVARVSVSVWGVPSRCSKAWPGEHVSLRLRPSYLHSGFCKMSIAGLYKCILTPRNWIFFHL